MRLDILQYIARGCPRLDASNIAAYKPRDKILAGKPEELLPRFHKILDDGHTIKVARALMIAERVSRGWEGKGWVRVKGEAEWLRAVYVLMDATEGVDQEHRYVRGAGFDEAWSHIPKLK